MKEIDIGTILKIPVNVVGYITNKYCYDHFAIIKIIGIGNNRDNKIYVGLINPWQKFVGSKILFNDHLLSNNLNLDRRYVGERVYWFLENQLNSFDYG